MNEINLLPQELKPNSSIIKLASMLKKIALLSVTVLLIVVTLSLGTYLFYSQKVSSSLSKQEDLKRDIKALEKTEQRLVLIKDRLQKIDTVVKKSDAADEIDKLITISSLFSPQTLIETVEITETDLEVGVSSSNLDGVTAYLASVISSGKYQKINLISLQFNPGEGYLVELSFPE